MNREDYPILKTDLIYFDNAATSLKPQSVINKITEYYTSYPANAHRGDYDIAFKTSVEYEKVRTLVKDFINAHSPNEIVFTSGTTEAINLIGNGYFRNILKENDEIIVTKSDHASNLLPWFHLAQELDLKIKYIELDADYQVTIANLKKIINAQTKVIALAQITNVIGDVRPIKEICELAHQNNILVVVDGAQSVAHIKVDVQDLNCDFFAFSAHKMGGPTGSGVLYVNRDLLDQWQAVNLGGGMNESFDSENEVILKPMPYLLEAGTSNIAAVLGLGAAISYLMEIGLDKINAIETDLRAYALAKLAAIPHIDLINPNSGGSIITFNVKDIFSQDVACYLNKYHICLRAGDHCAKMLKDVIGVKNTCRLSLAFYNTKTEIDYLVSLLQDKDKIIKEML